MYWKYVVYNMINRANRKKVYDTAARISKEISKSTLFIIIDILFSWIKYGCFYTEYENLSFYNKSKEERSKYFCVYQEYRLAKKINKKEYRNLFHNKINFLRTFSGYIKRNWICTEDSDEKISKFLLNNREKKVVLKYAMGDSGKEVMVYSVPRYITTTQFLDYMQKNNFDLAEEWVTNHPDMAKLNESSLNTIRIVTVTLNGVCDVLFAGVRVGAQGAEIDNISMGGAVARIDIDTGAINSDFRIKATVHGSNIIKNSHKTMKGYQIPFWSQLVSMVKEAALVIPQIGIVAWDVCITENGPEFVEGNESFGCVIMQLFDNCKDNGVKPKLMNILNSSSHKRWRL